MISARAIATAVREGRSSAVEQAQAALERIAAYDAVQPQAWISRPSPDDVLTYAAAIDARLAAGEILPLAGVMFAVKDNIDVARTETTAACPAFAYAPERSAHVVQALLDAGAVFMGKTNLDQFATGLVGTRSPYGAPGCVFNRAFVSGGSSSGSAVAVAAGLVPLALGTDTAGSGRVPAAINGLVGFKPTKGRWSTSGLVPACRSLDCVTVFAGNAADAALVDDVVAGFDAADPFSRHAPAEGIGAAAPRFAVPRADQLNFLGDAQSAALFAEAIKRIPGKPVEVDISPLLAAAKLLYGGPWVAERAHALADMLTHNPSAIHPVVRAIVEPGRAVSAVEAFDGAYRLAALARASETIWAGADILILPTCPTVYKIDAVLADPVTLNANLGLYTNFVNLLDMCAVAVPAGFRADGTGFGVTLIGPAWADRALLTAARAYEEALPMPAVPPLDLAEPPPSVKLAVVGAHLQGMPLHWQLTSRNARFVGKTRTAASYRLYAIANSTPPKPALIHDLAGASIELEIYELSLEAFGAFTAEVPAPLAIGTVILEGGETVKGFVAEPRAMDGAREITHLGGWRAFVAGG